MQTATSTDVQNHFGEYLEKVRKEPVHITRSGRAAAVLISPEDYDLFQAMENAYWVDIAMEAKKMPDIASEEAVAFLRKRFAELGEPFEGGQP